MAKIMGANWKELTGEEKQKYVDLAEKDKERYATEKELWDIAHPDDAKPAPKKRAPKKKKFAGAAAAAGAPAEDSDVDLDDEDAAPEDLVLPDEDEDDDDDDDEESRASGGVSRGGSRRNVMPSTSSESDGAASDEGLSLDGLLEPPPSEAGGGSKRARDDSPKASLKTKPMPGQFLAAPEPPTGGGGGASSSGADGSMHVGAAGASPENKTNKRAAAKVPEKITSAVRVSVLNQLAGTITLAVKIPKSRDVSPVDKILVEVTDANVHRVVTDANKIARTAKWVARDVEVPGLSPGGQMPGTGDLVEVTLTGLSVETAYSVRLRAVNAIGPAPNWSNFFEGTHALRVGRDLPEISIAGLGSAAALGLSCVPRLRQETRLRPRPRAD